MRIRTEDERKVATQTLKEVMQKLEEALQLSQRREQTHEEHLTAPASRGRRP